MTNTNLSNSLGLRGLSLSDNASTGKDHRLDSSALPSLEGFPAVVDSILYQSDNSTLLACRLVSTYFRDQADRALFDESLITDLSKGDIVIKSKGRVLPCFHPDSPEEGKIKTLSSTVVTTCTAFSHYQELAPLLIKYLPCKGVLIIYGMPLAEGHIKFPKIHSLQVQLDLRRKDAMTPTATIEHESECVAIDLELSLMEPTHWWKLIPFLRPNSLHCAHIWGHGKPRMSWINLGPCTPVPGQFPGTEWLDERNDNWFVHVSCPDLKGGGLNEAMRTGVRHSLAIVLASPDERILDSAVGSPFWGYEGPSRAVIMAEAQARACEEDASNSDETVTSPSVGADELIRSCAQQ
ncbi:hypothetical protein A1Q2_00439 [Trichosporon asahii var. asahii CBS 8904]|uniref:Uncharacterized protein n=1 Tax=Trichosporon asahii var. asahii (strain CBS 8904) TaxID=1220162 RepID=K1WWX8_TRIAC|nr:hypothetical protein A1Q2_00439 [Trichosporon asahii var. asahii CBS 8904]